jgi:hypothetical protein
MAVHSITRRNLFTFLETLQKDYSVFVPVKKGKQRFYRQFASLSPSGETQPTEEGLHVVFGEVRAFEPLKVFFFRARETVAEGFSDELPLSREKPYCIVGAKACDLKGFQRSPLYKTEGAEPGHFGGLYVRHRYLLLCGPSR